MMYKVYYDDYLLEDPRLDDYKVGSPTLKEELNKVDTFEFTIYDNHPNKGVLQNLVPKIRITKNNKTIFKGRIYNTKENIDKSKQVYVESVLAFLNDTIQEPFSFTGSAATLFTTLINSHNSQVSDNARKFKIGKTTGANLDNNDYVVRSSESYMTTWKAIDSKILSIGGYIYVDYNDDDTLTINWVDDFTENDNKIVSGQTIEFRENLVDITAENKADETYSVIMPLGYEIENEDGTKTRLTIESVNNNSKFLINQEALNNYGWRVMPIEESTWNDVTNPSNLKTKGQKLLDSQGVMLKSTLNISAADLSALDVNIDDFSKGEYIRVVSTPHNLSGVYLLTQKNTPLKEPNNITITLGEEKKTLTGIQFSEINSIKNTVGIINANYVKNKELAGKVEETVTKSTIIQQEIDNIVLSAMTDYVKTDDFGTFKETVSTAIKQTSTDITFSFDKLSEVISKTDENTQNQFQTISKYIRFDGGITMGEVGNEVTLRLENDIIYFSVSNVKIMEITPNGIVIEKITTNEINLDKYSFILDEDGYLTGV